VHALVDLVLKNTSTDERGKTSIGAKALPL
jgi:hypothetical protein